MNTAVSQNQNAPSIDPMTFRSVMGQYPTGVVLVTGIDENGDPQGMVVGTFSSVSLEPTLVSFMPTLASSSWKKMESIKELCINVLAADQEDLCRTFASKAVTDKWANVKWRPGPGGAPIVDGAISWIACTVDEILTRGDHYIVLGLVHHMEAVRSVSPLTFIRGGYGRFTTESLVSEDVPGLMDQLRVSQSARAEMEALAHETGFEVTAQAAHGDELVILAAAGGDDPDWAGAQHIGIRLPFIPPFGALFMAWASESRVDHWLNNRWSIEDDFKKRMLGELDAIREAGFAVVTPVEPDADRIVDQMFAGENVESGTIKDLRDRVQKLDPFLVTKVDANDQHTVRYIGAPVFDAQGRVILSIHLVIGEELGGREIQTLTAQLRETAARITEKNGGVQPEAAAA